MDAGVDASTAPAPGDPPYILADDLAARATEARRELGGRAATQSVGVFLLIGAPGWSGAPFAQSVDLTRTALEAYFHDRFVVGPARAISVYLFPSAAPYEAYCRARGDARCLSKYGFYLPDRRALVLNAGLGLGTLTHELVHPILEADFPEAPTWLNEGIASLYEAPILARRGEVHGAKNWRWPRLVAALADPKERARAGIDALFGMSDEAFRDQEEDLHYASARYLCQWLDQKALLWVFYRRWREAFARDPTGEATFAAVVGRSPAAARDEWVRWVRAL
jgi:hypothetical protein